MVVRLVLCDRYGTPVGETLLDDADYFDVCFIRWHKAVGYARATVDGKQIYLHDYLMSPPLGHEVDHINRDKLDNQRANLRVVTHAQNHQNKGPYKGRSTRGAFWTPERRKWRSRSRLDGVQIHHGYFDTEEDAAGAAAEWRRVNMPFSTD